MFCEQCGAGLEQDARFCGMCGSRLGEEEVDSSGQQPARSVSGAAEVRDNLKKFCQYFSLLWVFGGASYSFMLIANIGHFREHVPLRGWFMLAPVCLSFLYYLLYRYISNRWESMGGIVKFLVALPCWAPFAVGLWPVFVMVFYIILGVVVVIAFFAGGGGAYLPGGPKDREMDRDANLRGIQNTLDDINRKL